jgi:hypothetical protein
MIKVIYEPVHKAVTSIYGQEYNLTVICPACHTHLDAYITTPFWCPLCSGTLPNTRALLRDYERSTTSDKVCMIRYHLTGDT